MFQSICLQSRTPLNKNQNMKKLINRNELLNLTRYKKNRVIENWRVDCCCMSHVRIFNRMKLSPSAIVRPIGQ